VRHYLAAGRQLRLATPRAFQRLLAQNIAAQRATENVTGRRPSVRERRVGRLPNLCL
jgi:hypothetical protein